MDADGCPAVCEAEVAGAGGVEGFIVQAAAKPRVKVPNKTAALPAGDMMGGSLGGAVLI